MNTDVHILVTCETETALRGATLFAETIRVGFPADEVFLDIQPGKWQSELKRRFKSDYRTSDMIIPRTHGQWIQERILVRDEPFIICDTDVVFWKEMTTEFDGATIAGRLIPGYTCPIVGLKTAARIHPSLMWIDPVKVRAIKPPTNFNHPLVPLINLWQAVTMPYSNGWMFYDTGSLAMNAALAARHHVRMFTEPELDCYDHMFFGTFENTIKDFVPEPMKAARELCWADPSKLKGAWRAQNEWLAAHPILPQVA